MNPSPSLNPSLNRIVWVAMYIAGCEDSSSWEESEEDSGLETATHLFPSLVLFLVYNLQDEGCPN